MRTAPAGFGVRRHPTDDLVRRRLDSLFDPTPDPVRGAAAPTAAPYRPPPGALPAPGAPLSADPSPPDPLPPPAPAPASAEARPVAAAPRSRSDPAVPRRPLLPLALQERLDLDRRALIGLAVLLLLALGYGVQHFWMGRPAPMALPAAESTAEADPGAGVADPGTGSARAPTPQGTGRGAAQPGGAGVVVDVAGRVREPGLHTLRPGARVQDALRAAGGPVPGTDLTGLNLARIVNDGEEIIVGAPAPAPGAAVGAGVPGSGVPLSLNSATVEQLDALPGLGPVLARRVIQYRDQHGGFRSVDQLRQVSGFGERRLQDLRPLLRP